MNPFSDHLSVQINLLSSHPMGSSPRILSKTFVSFGSQSADQKCQFQLLSCIYIISLRGEVYVGIIAVYTLIALSLIGCSCHHDTWSLCMEQEMLPLLRVLDFAAARILPHHF